MTLGASYPAAAYTPQMARSASEPQVEVGDLDLYRALRSNQNWAVQQVADRITPLVRSKLFRGTSWEDVRQHCLLNIIQVVRRTERCDNPWGLIRKITVCTVIDYNRRQRLTRQIFEAPPDADSNATGQEDRYATVADPRREHADDFADRELYRYVCQRLRSACRELFELVFVEDLSYPEAAARLGITEGNLRVRIKRCRDHALKLRDEAFEA